jgi:hypothetical protein
MHGASIRKEKYRRFNILLNEQEKKMSVKITEESQTTQHFKPQN